MTANLAREVKRDACMNCTEHAGCSLLEQDGIQSNWLEFRRNLRHPDELEWQANIFQSETPVLAALIWGYVFNADVRTFTASASSLPLLCIRSDFMYQP